MLGSVVMDMCGCDDACEDEYIFSQIHSMLKCKSNFRRSIKQKKEVRN